MRICPVCGELCDYDITSDTSKCRQCTWTYDESEEANRKAVYAGSFDPFTNGHLYIIQEASEMFDKVYVLIANNANKKRSTNTEEMAEAIAKTMFHEGLFNVCIVIYDGLVADFCLDNNVEYLIRGLRNTSDYLYEENIAKINHEINPNLKTIYYRANNDVVSSSLVREMLSYGKDIDKYVPEEVAILLNDEGEDF